MDRRNFLKFVFTGSSALLLNFLFPRPYKAQEIDLYDIYGAFSSRIGGETISRLRGSSSARNTVESVVQAMDRSGFRMTPDGIITDTRRLTDIPRAHKYIHDRYTEEIECFALAIDVGLYSGLTYIPLPDICVAWLIGNNETNSDYQNVVMFEGPAVLATGIGSADYAYQRWNISDSNDLTSNRKRSLARYFLPAFDINPSQVGLGGTFATSASTQVSYQNQIGGEVNVDYTPPQRSRGRDANIEIAVTDNRGEIEFHENYDFDIV